MVSPLPVFVRPHPPRDTRQERADGPPPALHGLVRAPKEMACRWCRQGCTVSLVLPAIGVPHRMIYYCQVPFPTKEMACR